MKKLVCFWINVVELPVVAALHVATALHIAATLDVCRVGFFGTFKALRFVRVCCMRG